MSTPCTTPAHSAAPETVALDLSRLLTDDAGEIVTDAAGSALFDDGAQD